MMTVTKDTEPLSLHDRRHCGKETILFKQVPLAQNGSGFRIQAEIPTLYRAASCLQTGGMELGELASRSHGNRPIQGLA